MSFLNYIINGLSLGSVYAIIALGYTMVYGIAKMLNFAHGDVIMISGYVVFTCMSSMKLPAIVSILIAMAVCTVLGITIEKVAYRPLRDASSSLAVLITAIGVSYLLQNVALLIFGADTKIFTSVVDMEPLTFFEGQLVIKGEALVTIIVCIVIMIGLTLFVNKTKAGQAMQAVSEDKGAATDKCDALKKAMTEITVDGLTGNGIVWSAEGEPTKEPKAVVIAIEEVKNEDGTTALTGSYKAM